jgi:hypothetical protein
MSSPFAWSVTFSLLIPKQLPENMTAASSPAEFQVLAAHAAHPSAAASIVLTTVQSRGCDELVTRAATTLTCLSHPRNGQRVMQRCGPLPLLIFIVENSENCLLSGHCCEKSARGTHFGALRIKQSITAEMDSFIFR